jgi:hypothetical protein
MRSTLTISIGNITSLKLESVGTTKGNGITIVKGLAAKGAFNSCMAAMIGRLLILS